MKGQKQQYPTAHLVSVQKQPQILESNLLKTHGPVNIATQALEFNLHNHIIKKLKHQKKRNKMLLLCNHHCMNLFNLQLFLIRQPYNWR